MSVYENKLKECLQNGVIEESRFLPDVYVAKNYDMEKGLLNELVLTILLKKGERRMERENAIEYKVYGKYALSPIH